MDKVATIVSLLQDYLTSKRFVEVVPVLWVLVHSLKGESQFESH